MSAPPVSWAVVEVPLWLAGTGITTHLGEGGLVAWLIVALSVVLISLACMQLVTIRYSTQCPEELFLRIDEYLSRGQLPRAKELAGRDPSALALVAEAVLKSPALPRTELREIAHEATSEQSIRLNQRISYIGLIATIAPMLGLLGTVSGMIRAFSTMSAGQQPEATQLAAAISEALITTYLGLTVAIPALVLYLVLRNRATNITLRLATNAEHLVDRLTGSPANGRDPRPAPAARASR